MKETDLGRKLRRAFKVAGNPPRQDEDDPAGVRELLQRRQARAARQGPRRVPLPAGAEATNAAGSYYLRSLSYDLKDLHGDLHLGACWDVDCGRIAELARDEAFRDLDLGQCLFLDTETTGLGGGAGTMVFLCGLGFLVGRELRLEQVFLRSFGDEPGALQHVADRLGRYPTLVSYVGKSFDRHRLQARMAVNRISGPMLEAPHLDLYYLARRAWGRRLPDVRLQTVEREVLGFRRADDLPGAEAPVAFLDWVRDGSGPVDRVFEHNRLDVLSLVALLGALGRG